MEVVVMVAHQVEELLSWMGTRGTKGVKSNLPRSQQWKVDIEREVTTLIRVGRIVTAPTLTTLSRGAMLVPVDLMTPVSVQNHTDLEMRGDTAEVRFEATADTGLNILDTTSTTERTHPCNILERFHDHLYLRSPMLRKPLTLLSTLLIKLGRKISAPKELDLIAFLRDQS
jgi:hypothetical protein